MELACQMNQLLVVYLMSVQTPVLLIRLDAMCAGIPAAVPCVDSSTVTQRVTCVTWICRRRPLLSQRVSVPLVFKSCRLIVIIKHHDFITNNLKRTHFALTLINKAFIFPTDRPVRKLLIKRINQMSHAFDNILMLWIESNKVLTRQGKWCN